MPRHRSVPSVPHPGRSNSENGASVTARRKRKKHPRVKHVVFQMRAKPFVPCGRVNAKAFCILPHPRLPCELRAARRMHSTSQKSIACGSYFWGLMEKGAVTAGDWGIVPPPVPHLAQAQKKHPRTVFTVRGCPLSYAKFTHSPSSSFTFSTAATVLASCTVPSMQRRYSSSNAIHSHSRNSSSSGAVSPRVSSRARYRYNVSP